MPTYSIDGVALDGPRWCLLEGTQYRPSPAARAAQVTLPGQHGSVPILPDTFEAGLVALRIGVFAATTAERDESIEALTGLLRQRHRLVDLRYTRDAGVTRQAYARVDASVEPEVATDTSAILTVVLSIPGALWRDVASADWVASLASGQVVTVTPLTGSTAPVPDAVLVVRGPVIDPVVTDVATGSSVRYVGSLAEGNDLRLDLGSFVARAGASILWTGTGTDVTGSIEPAGAGSASRWLHLTPAMQGTDPLVREVHLALSGGGFTAATRLYVRARRAFI